MDENMNIPENYKPISMWGYLGYELLFSIPCIGLILILVFSFGGTQNKNLKNFARSYLIIMVISIILMFFIIGAGISGTILSTASNTISSSI